MLFENRNGFKAPKLTALLLGALMILSAFSVLFSTTNTETVTLSSSDFAIPEELAPLFEDAEKFAKVIEAADHVDGFLKVGESLQPYYKDGSLPENAIVRNDRLAIMVLAAPNANLDKIAMNMKIDSKVDLGMFWMIFGSIKNRADLIELTEAPGMLMAEADVNLFNTKTESTLDLQELKYEVPEEVDPISPDQAFTREHYGVDDVIEDGDGVLVGVCDSGVDFGQSNIETALGLTLSGYPASLAPAGEGIFLTPVEINTSTDLVDGVFSLNGTGLSMPSSGGLVYGSPIELNIEDIEFNITESEATNGLHSESGVYKIGILNQELDSGRWPGYQSFFVLLADSSSKGVYNQIWIDWTTSALSNWFRGFMRAQFYHGIDTAYAPLGWTQEAWNLAPEVNASAGNQIFIDETAAHMSQHYYVKWYFKGWTNITYDGILANVTAACDFPAGTFTQAGEWLSASSDNEKVTNFVLAHDFDSDGHNDISAGSLCNSLDVANVINETMTADDPVMMLKGIDPDGQGFATMLDPHGHGTACASTIAGRGSSFAIYDEYLPSGDYYTGYPTYYGASYTKMPTNSTPYDLYGMASNADIMAVNLFTSASYFLQFIWQAGFDLVLPENTTLGSNWIYTGEHAAQISSNSWGWTATWRFAYGGPGLHFGAVLIDILSTPGYFDDSYPGILFCFSTGNDGTGYGTFGDFSMSTSALSVGGSTMKHYYEFEYGYGVMHDQLYMSSSKGPSLQGWSGPDILANAYRGCSATAVWDHGYWDDRPETAGAYGSSGDLTFGFWQGTSLACPTAAGIAALVVEAAGVGSFDPWEVKTIIKSTAMDLGFDSFTQGAGRIDPVNAVKMANGTTIPYYKVQSNQTNVANGKLLLDVFKFWFTTPDSFYESFEGLPGAYLNDSSIPENLPTGILDTDFYGGLLTPGESVTGTIFLDGATTAAPVYNAITDQITGSVDLDNSSAQWAALYNETMIPVKLSDILTSGEMTAIGAADSIEIAMYPNTTTTVGGASMRTPAVINWNDINTDGHLDFAVDSASDPTGEQGEFGIVCFGDGYYFPIANPAAAFPNEATIVFRFTGTQNNSFNLTGTEEYIYEYYDVGGITIDYTINVYSRSAWSVVSTTDLGNNYWSVTISVPTDALPGAYSGYLELDNGQLVPVSYGVAGAVPERIAGGEAKTEWTGTKTVNDAAHSNYVISVAGDGDGEGDFRFFPLQFNDDANALFVNITSTEGTGLKVRLLDPLGWEIDSLSSTTGNVVFFADLSAYATDLFDGAFMYLTVQALDLAVAEDSFTVEVAYTDEDIAGIMPAVAIESETADLVNNTVGVMTGPHVNLTATYTAADFFPEVEVSNIEVWIPGVTTEVIEPAPFEGPIGANEYAYHYYDFNEGDIVNLECNWVVSADLDIYVYDPNGDPVDIYNPNYGWVYYGMATGAKPERGYFIAAMTGEYEFEIYEWNGDSGASYTLTLSITRPSPVTSASNTITIDTMIVNGAPIPDGDYVMEVWGFTNSRMVWKHYFPYSVDNWLAPTIDIAGDIIAVNETVGRGEVSFSWTASDINAGETLRPVGDDSDSLLYHVEWRIIYSSALSYFVPGGIIEFGSSEWTLAATITETSFTWDITDTDAVPDGVYEFRVTADDRGSDELNSDTIIVSIATGHIPQPDVITETVTVTETSIVTTTVTITASTSTTHGITVMVMLVGLVGLFVLRKKRR